MDHTKHDIETLLLELKPNFVFFDFAHWIPTLTRRLGIKSMHYMIISPVAVAYDISPARQVQGGNLTEHELMQPPQGFPDPSIKLNIHEARANVAIRTKESGGGVSIVERLATASSLSDAIGFKGCREIDGPFVDYLAQFGKCVLLSGPVIPNPPASSLEEKWALWLKGFKAGSVTYCTLGREFILQLNQFQELLLGLELSGMPFFAALKPPTGFDPVEAALPEGFKERIQGRGNVYGGWVQQQLILEHPSVGCYICHCGVGSLLEGLVNQCQLVFLPCIADQIFNARLMANSLKVGVEVEKGEEDGLFTKESVCKAITTVMDNDNETGREVRANHAKLREILLKKDFETAYIDNFCKNLQDLCK